MEPILRFCDCEIAQEKGQERKEKIGRKENKGKEHSCELRMPAPSFSAENNARAKDVWRLPMLISGHGRDKTPGVLCTCL